MANGFLTGQYGKGEHFDPKTDYRAAMPQFTDEAVEQNTALLKLLRNICLLYTSTSAIRQQEELKTNSVPELEMMKKPFDENTSIDMVKNDPVFDDYGRLLFPADDGYMSGDTLGDLQLTWYNYIDPAETVKIVNTLWQRANDGETVFYDIYSDAEKRCV